MVRHDQKMTIYGRIADENALQIVPVVFSHVGQIQDAFKFLSKAQTRQKLICFETQAKRNICPW